MRTITVDGSPETLERLVSALDAAIHDRGPAVAPVAAADGRTEVVDTDEDVAVVVATSGSTGTPRRVALSASALHASAGATAHRLAGEAAWLLALPAEHVAGVQVIVRALLAGAPPVALDLRTGFTADGFAAATARLPRTGRRHTSLVPTQLRRLLDADGPGLEALRSFDAVLVGGAALDDGLRERADAAGVAVTTTYGMSETAGGCVYDGVPLDGVTVDLLATGRIVLGGPTLASGYLDDPDATAAAFVDGRFRTNDLGTWDGQRLVVLGRADDVIVTGGENVAPAAVERALLAEPGVAAACVVGIPDAEWGQLVSAAIVADGARPSDHRLRAAVRAALGRAAVPRVIVEVAELPLRGIGKPDRVAVAALVARARA